MLARDRYKFRFGTYKTPKFNYGSRVNCLIRGKMKIVGLTGGRIPWPVGQFGKHKAIIVFRDLGRAIRRESNQAVAYWWGVKPTHVSQWRKALGVGPVTKGTSALRSDHFNEPWGKRARKKAWSKARDPKRRAKIAAALHGKPKSPEAVAASRRARIGRKASEETRRRMSEAHRRNGVVASTGARIWQPWEDKLLETLPVEAVARRTKRTVSAVQARRWKLRLPLIERP